MTLFEHLRELRYRLVVIAVAIIVGTVIAYVFHDQIFNILMRPYEIAQAQLQQQHPKLHVQSVVEGVTNPFTLVLKTCFIAALIGTSPIWIYQIWAFIVPGLLAKEKKMTLIFLSAAIPLFLLGVSLAYFVIPKGIAVLIGFTPGDGDITNLLDIQNFLNFLIRVMIVFGAGFELPVFVVGLNFLGILKAKQISKARSFVIFGCFVFGAIATPQTDPLSMLLLAVPMTILFLAAEVICHIHDRAIRNKIGDGEVDAGRGIANDRALAELDGREVDDLPQLPTSDEIKTQSRQTVADLLGLNKSTGQDDATS
ncbi:twin-arginine translocase subunit TatC [Microlunatus elymi]|nr:twin-arginine translocase subunit TatC [Microlunatus elymi]